MERYDVLKRLGDGTYGSVWMGKHRNNGDIVAIKILKRKFSTWNECVVLRELKALQSLPIHDNVVTIKELIREEDSQLYFVFEYMPDGNLYQLMKQSIEIRKHQLQLHQLQQLQQQQCNTNSMNYMSSFTSNISHQNNPGFLTPERIHSITAQVLKGLDHIHSLGYVHRDIKPENLLLKGNVCKIADFGLARKPRSRTNSPSLTEYISTRWYRAPEVLLRSPKYSTPIDIFAVGCVLSEMIELKPLFPGASEIDQTHKVFSLLGQPNEVNWPEGVALFHRLKVKPSILPASLPIYEYGRIGGGGGDAFWNAATSQNRINQESTSRMSIMRAVPNAAADPITISFLQRLLTMNPDDRPSAKESLNDAYFKSTTDQATATVPAPAPANQRISFNERYGNVNTNINTNDQTINRTTNRNTNRNNRKRKSIVETPYIHVAAVNTVNYTTKRNGVLTSTPCLEECHGQVQNQAKGQGQPYHYAGSGYGNDAIEIAPMQERKNRIQNTTTTIRTTTTCTQGVNQQPFSTILPAHSDLNEFEQQFNPAQHFQIPTSTNIHTDTNAMATTIDYQCQYPLSHASNNRMTMGMGDVGLQQQQQHQHQQQHPISSSVHSLSSLQSHSQSRFLQQHNPFTFYDTLGMGISGHSYS